MEIKNIDIHDLKPYKYNPRDNSEAIEVVANSIQEFGFKVPIVVAGDMTIIAGHTRLEAAKIIGLKEVPCIIADDLSDSQIKAFRVADNKIAEIAEWDRDLLVTEMEELLNLDFDMEKFGFSEQEINSLMNSEFDLSEVGELEEYEEPEEKQLCCPNCGFKGLRGDFN